MPIYLAKRSMHLSILSSLRKEDPFLDVKLFTKEDLAKYIFPSIKEEATLYLMKSRHLSYETAKYYLKYVPYVRSDSSNQKIKFLYELKNKLEEKELLISPNLNHLKEKDVVVIGYSKDDFELNYTLKELGLKATYLERKKFNGEKVVDCFSKVEDATYFVLNEIASLIDKGVSPNDIYIFRRNKEYDYYLKKFSSSFGFSINLRNDTSLALTGAYKEFIKLYKENKD